MVPPPFHAPANTQTTAPQRPKDMSFHKYTPDMEIKLQHTITNRETRC